MVATGRCYVSRYYEGRCGPAPFLLVLFCYRFEREKRGQGALLGLVTAEERPSVWQQERVEQSDDESLSPG